MSLCLEAVPQTCSVEKLVLEISQNSQKKHLCQGLLFNKVAGPRPSILLKKRPWHTTPLAASVCLIINAMYSR